jgi:hypothetical protein
VLPSLHAGFSFGGLAGAVLGGLAAAAAPPAVHLLLVGACAVLVTVAVGPTLLAADGDRVTPGGGATRAGAARGLVVLLGVIAGCTAFGEGAVTDWGALHLQEMGASPLLAAAGYAGFSLAMASGRLAGNGLVRALGPTRVMAGGALLAAAGAAVAAGVPVVGAGIAGFVLIGLGLANVFPIAIARAGAHAGAAGVALASTVGYTGLLGGPPLLGIVAEAVGLHVAFGAVALLAAAAAGLTLLARTPQARPARWRTAAAALGQQLRTTAEPALRQARAGLVASAGRARTAAHGHAQGLDLLHDQLTGSRSRPRPYPGLEALAA